jgi:hypothetical protein
MKYNKKTFVYAGIILLSVFVIIILTTVFSRKQPPSPIPTPPSPIPTPPSPIPTPPSPIPTPPSPIPTPPSPIPTPPSPIPSFVESFYKGVPLSIDTTRNFTNFQEVKRNCITSQKGVVNVLSTGQIQCNEYITGTLISNFQILVRPPLTDVSKYLTSVYPAYPQSFSSNFQRMLENLETTYSGVNGTSVRRVPVDKPVFYHTEYIEVLPKAILFSKLDKQSWKGTWYDVCNGTGWFLPNTTTLFCYNCLHAANLMGIPDEVILSAGGNPEFIEKRTLANNFEVKFSLQDSIKRIIAQVAIQRGYKTIQISNEWNGTIYERLCVDLIEPIYSMKKLVQKNPFEIKTNNFNENLWLDIFLTKNVNQVDSLYILDVVSPKRTLQQRYGDFAFKTGCAKQNGTINMGDMLLNCELIVKFGMPSKRLDSEIANLDITKYPSSTELEKLQSYFTIVYENADVWKTKDLQTLQDYWKRMEMRYLLPKEIMPQSPHNTYKRLNFGVNAPGMLAFQEDGRLAETVQYVEVIRQNLKNSYYDSSAVFAGMYYYPCRGSGLFVPVGNLFIAKTKQLAAKVWQQSIAPSHLPEDIDIAKIAMYKGYDTVMFVRYSGYTSPEAVELLHLKDPITSQMSLIRTHPWDPQINVSIPYNTRDDYGQDSGIDISKCITNKQYQPGVGNAKCPSQF